MRYQVGQAHSSWLVLDTEDERWTGAHYSYVIVGEFSLRGEAVAWADARN